MRFSELVLSDLCNHDDHQQPDLFVVRRFEAAKHKVNAHLFNFFVFSLVLDLLFQLTSRKDTTGGIYRNLYDSLKAGFENYVPSTRVLTEGFWS